MTAAGLARRFLHEVLVGFLAAAVLAVAGYMLFAITGCSGDVGSVAEPLDVAGDDAGAPDDGPELDDAAGDESALGESRLPRAPLSAVLGTPNDSAVDSHAVDSAPTTDSAVVDSARDSAPASDIKPPPDAPACPSGVYCTHPAGGRVGASCFTSVDCCSGYCFDPVPGDGIKGACRADDGAPGWCGTTTNPEWCPTAPDKICQ